MTPAHSAVNLLTASAALPGLKNPMFLNLGSSSVARDIMLMDCRLWSLSLSCLLRWSATDELTDPGCPTSSSSEWSSIIRSGITLEPDTLFSSESSTVASLNGPRTRTHPAMTPYSLDDVCDRAMSVVKLARAAPTGSLMSKTRFSMW